MFGNGGLNFVFIKFDFFYLKLIFFIFKLFWCVDIKNKFFKIKKILF
jgi:hypothetical protein